MTVRACRLTGQQELDGRVPAASLRGKYVLIGATAASLGDRVASPFVHSTDVRGNQHGAHTLLRRAAGRLQRYPSPHWGIDTEGLAATALAQAEAIEDTERAGLPSPALAYPKV